ncbi:hypothetical protein D3C76_1676090 [compost metagenome]
MPWGASSAPLLLTKSCIQRMLCSSASRCSTSAGKLTSRVRLAPVRAKPFSTAAVLGAVDMVELLTFAAANSHCYSLMRRARLLALSISTRR